jgi:uncharacterized iron-regulated membrane protein
VRLNLLTRKFHRWGALAIALPLLVVISTGLLLQLKKQVRWVQPAEQRGADTVPVLSMERILAASRSVPEAQVRGWGDVDRIDVRPAKGILKVTSMNRWEVQIDAQTGAVLQSAYRRSDLLEQLHDGSWFHDAAKLWLFFPSGVVLLGLWLTGIWLFWLPYRVKRKRRHAAEHPELAPPRRTPRAASTRAVADTDTRR